MVILFNEVRPLAFFRALGWGWIEVGKFWRELLHSIWYGQVSDEIKGSKARRARERRKSESRKYCDSIIEKFPWLGSLC
jgi:hypothetical protein